MPRIRILSCMLVCLCFASGYAQNTQIRGFANFDASFSNDSSNPSFFLGEQDLFITSEINDKISFLGESVFKFSPNSPTQFNVSMERLIIKYNYFKNHNILLGKHHTPSSLWNDKYHHGRVLFPSINRPMLFGSGILEVHSTGILFQGLNLGNNNIGYQFLIGNGIGSSDIKDDNAYKSLTLDLHAKPVKGMKFGVTAYKDRFTNGASDHHGTGHGHTHDSLDHLEVSMLTTGAYFSYFKGKYEMIGEAHFAMNETDSIGKTQNSTAYLYLGYRIKDEFVPYVVYDVLSTDDNEVHLEHVHKNKITVGLRYEFSYLANAKIEFNRINMENGPVLNSVNFQMAVGF